MATFIVTKREIWTSGIEIEADNEDQALEFAQQGGGTEIDGLLEYSHTLGSETWTAEEVVDKLSDEELDLLTNLALENDKTR